MKKIKFYALCLLATAVMFGCSKYDDSELKNDVNNLKSGVEKLETWCNTVNGQISALQGLVTALEKNDCISGVTPIMEGAKEVGYTIAFTKSKSITIMHGKNGAQGEAGKDGITPIIGVQKDTDGLYYWTIQMGEAAATWMKNAEGNKIRTTGDKDADGQPGTDGSDGADGHSPVLSVATFEGRLYWKIDGRWLLDGENKVPATGDKGDTGSAGSQGDGIFAEDGIDYTTDPANVIFTLADGTTKITLPKASTVTVGFDKYDLFYGSALNNEITLILPSTLKETDYTAIVATVANESGTGMDIQTRSVATENIWGVKVTKPLFTNEALVAGSAKVSITPPAKIKLSETAMLKVTITDKHGKEFSVARPIKFFDGQIVECIAGNLSAVATNVSVTRLAIKGSISDADFSYIKQTLTALEVLDLSMTNLPSIPDRALAFYNPLSANTTLKRVVLPATAMTIGEAAFANCCALESIDTENAESIGQGAFENCKKLNKVKLGDKLTTINQFAFLNCKSLTSLDIPSNVTTLGQGLFEYCDNLGTITLHEGLQNLAQYTFYGCGVVSIHIPSTVTVIPEGAFLHCKKLERITMHDDITSIGAAAFWDCLLLKSIKIPAGVTIIANNTFHRCKSLQFVVFHNQITEIQEHAFASCASLMSEDPNEIFNLPTSLTTLGRGAFRSCSNLSSVDMSATSVTAIPDYLFANCKKLIDISLPTSLQTIGKWSFRACPLFVIELPATATAIGNDAFFQCAQLKAVTSKAVVAPTIGTETFDSSFKTGRKMHVPSGSDYSSWASYFDEKINLQ